MESFLFRCVMIMFTRFGVAGSTGCSACHSALNPHGSQGLSDKAWVVFTTVEMVAVMVVISQGYVHLSPRLHHHRQAHGGTHQPLASLASGESVTLLGADRARVPAPVPTPDT